MRIPIDKKLVYILWSAAYHNYKYVKNMHTETSLILYVCNNVDEKLSKPIFQ